MAIAPSSSYRLRHRVVRARQPQPRRDTALLHWAEAGLHVPCEREILRPVSEMTVNMSNARVGVRVPADCRVQSMPDYTMPRVERHIDLPEPVNRGRVCGRKQATKYPFEGMEVGDSFFVHAPIHRTPRSVQASLCGVLRSEELRFGRRYTSRTVELTADGRGGVRVWRIA